MQIQKSVVVLAVLIIAPALQGQNKAKLTIDDFFNSVSFSSVELSPDGNSVVIVTERADWDQQIFRTDLWLYRDDVKTLIQLTQSGHDSDPKWSPDGKWIAFLSERKNASGKSDDSDSGSDSEEDASQLYLISPTGGEAFPITRGEEDVHTFAWSLDSQTIYYATRQPWSKDQKDEYKREWKDVVQYRTAERGDEIFALRVPDAIARHASEPAKVEKNEGQPEAQPDLTPGADAIATMSLRIDDLVTSPDGTKLAFVTNAVNQRQEKYEDVELYLLDVKGGQPRRLTNNEAFEISPRWANDSRHILFSVELGDVSGSYRDLQPHLYWVDTNDGKIEQWDQSFIGPVEHYSVGADNVLASARIGTEVQIYSTTKPSDKLHRLTGTAGTYAQISTVPRSSKTAFIYSSLGKPQEVYLADAADRLDQARQITSFNQKLAEADLPQGKPYQWKADDGTTVEGMLIYPPGKFEQKHLPMFTFIHGGPADADGNHFEADWYQWAALAATSGWLVFEPNYRGSTGYGDKFLMQIVPQIVSKPGRDILAGVDALVKDGVADPDHLTIGGYSYGGYMTNWLITQTTRFRAAVTGAGAVEHVGNWGNDDTTYDDAYFLGGRPWEAQQRYHDEAAIFQIDKVKTPTHIVGGASDIRVAVLENYLLEHALYALGVPNKLLIFPGEGHGLGKNPWHGKIKVREELKWLEKYGGVPAN
ncbi:MAG TPA: S9 family peptidase [Candidatus Binatia bacterium]|nr:S9 family peptidase [Candidatus Binatia bacterium]